MRVVPGKEQLWELLLACQAFGAELDGCRSLPGEEQETYRLTLQTGGADVAALRYYLALGRSRSTVTGCYLRLLLPEERRQELLY